MRFIFNRSRPPKSNRPTHVPSLLALAVIYLHLLLAHIFYAQICDRRRFEAQHRKHILSTNESHLLISSPLKPTTENTHALTIMPRNRSFVFVGSQLQVSCTLVTTWYYFLLALPVPPLLKTRALSPVASGRRIGSLLTCCKVTFRVARS